MARPAPATPAYVVPITTTAPVVSSSAYPAYASSAVSTTSPPFLRQNARKEGYLTKQGGLIRNWKRRLFILNGMALYYFVNPASPAPQGVIQLKGASVSLNNGTFPYSSSAKYVFAIDTPSRRYYVEADNQTEFDTWVDEIQNAIRGKVTQFYGQPQPEQQTVVTTTTATYSMPAPQPSAPPPTSWGTAQAAQSGYNPIYPSLQNGQPQVYHQHQQQQQQGYQQPQQFYTQQQPAFQQQPYGAPPYGGAAPYGGAMQTSPAYSSNTYPYPRQNM